MKPQPSSITAEEFSEIAGAIADQYGVDLARLLGKTRRAAYVQARWALIVRLRALGLSLKKIGRLVNRHHSTVIHGLRQTVAQ